MHYYGILFHLHYALIWGRYLVGKNVRRIFYCSSGTFQECSLFFGFFQPISDEHSQPITDVGNWFGNYEPFCCPIGAELTPPWNIMELYRPKRTPYLFPPNPKSGCFSLPNLLMLVQSKASKNVKTGSILFYISKYPKP